MKRVSRALAAILLFATGLVFAADADFEKIARQTLAEIHAKNFREGNLSGCVSLYTQDAKFFVDHKLVASGEGELRTFYQGLRDADKIMTIAVDGFVEIGSREDVGWALFNYTKAYDLRTRDLAFLKRHQLEGFTSVNVKQYGTAIFTKREGQWRIQTMSVFDPEIWERKK